MSKIHRNVLLAVSALCVLAVLSAASAFGAATATESTDIVNVTYDARYYVSNAEDYSSSAFDDLDELFNNLTDNLTYPEALSYDASGKITAGVSLDLSGFREHTLRPAAKHIFQYYLSAVTAEAGDTSSSIAEKISTLNSSFSSTVNSNFQAGTRSAARSLGASSLTGSIPLPPDNSSGSLTITEAMSELALQKAAYGVRNHSEIEFTDSDKEFIYTAEPDSVVIAVGDTFTVNSAGWYAVELPVIAEGFYGQNITFSAIVSCEDTETYDTALSALSNYAFVNSLGSIVSAVPGADSSHLPGVVRVVSYFMPNVEYSPLVTMNYRDALSSAYTSSMSSSVETLTAQVKLLIQDFTDDYYSTVIDEADRETFTSSDYRFLNRPYNLFSTSGGLPESWTPSTAQLVSKDLAAVLTLPILYVNSDNGARDGNNQYVLKVKYQFPVNQEGLHLLSEDNLLEFYPSGLSGPAGEALFLDSSMNPITDATVRTLAASSSGGDVVERDGYIVMTLPTQSAAYNPIVTVKVDRSKPLALSSEGSLNITFAPGEANSSTFTVWANNVKGTVKWNIDDEELQPHGIDVSYEDVTSGDTSFGKKVIVTTGNNTIAGTYSIVFYADDDRALGFVQANSLTATIEVGASDLIIQPETSSTSARAGASFNMSFTLSGASGNVNWSLSAGNLGLRLSGESSTGASVSGTLPSNLPEGNYPFTVTATDEAGRTASASVSISITPTPDPEPTPSPDPTPTPDPESDDHIIDPPVSHIFISPAWNAFSVDAGEERTITLNAYNNNGTVHWEITNTSWSPNDDPLKLKKVPEGNSEVVITLTAPKLEDDAEYSFEVVAVDSYGQASAPIAIHVNGTGRIKSPDVPVPEWRTLPNVEARELVLTEEIAENLRTALMGRITGDIRVVSSSGIGRPVSPDADVAAAMSAAGYQVAASISTLTVSNDGYYAFVFTVPEAFVGMSMNDLSIFAKQLRITAASLSDSAASDVTEGMLFNGNGEEVTTAPSEMIAVVHLPANSTSGVFFGSVVIPAAGLNELTINPVEITDELRSNIAQSTGIADVRQIEDRNIFAPIDPTQAIVETIKDDGYELHYKMNTLIVSEDGYYAFEIVIPDELVNLPSRDVKIYSADITRFTAGSVRASDLLAGVGSVLELDSMGLKFDTIEKKLLGIVLLEAGKPFTFYLAKLLIVLLAGCDAGVSSAAGLGITALAGVITLLGANFFRRR